MNKNRKPEVLSPAGSLEAAYAAVAGGADAIYIGGKMLNARMNAKNFSDDALAECIRHCHENGVKVYVTLNTAVLDRELKSALDYADMLYSLGVDALIVSDTGLASAFKDRYPEMGIHASTQASGHNAQCAKALSELGFDRMVCARELSETDIKTLCEQSPIEIEQFVHGAMCVSQSGQCLASAMMGGRSGNRGVCAQPCRMSYNGAHPLSLKDMCLANHAKTLTESGVSSLKIEGRMKSPSYVYGVTKIYRRIIDEDRNATENEIKELAAIFSRGGFTDGYYTECVGSDMNGVRAEADISASRAIKTDFKKIERSIPKITINERTLPEPFNPPRAAKRTHKSGKPIYTARFTSPAQIKDTGFFSHTYLPIDKYEQGYTDGIVMPAAVFPRDEKRFRELLERAVKLGAEHALVTHIGQVRLALEYGLIPHGDFRLNVFNTLTAKYCVSLGMRDVILSPELTLPQMRDIDAPKAAIVYGKVPIMLLTKPVGASVLKDTRGARFEVIKDCGFDILLNSVPFYMADKQKALDENGIRGRHFIFTTENAKECSDIISAYKNGAPASFPIRRCSV